MQKHKLIDKAINDGVAKNIDIAFIYSDRVAIFHDSEMYYDVASLTKVVSGLLVSVLQHKGLIDVEDKVSNYLPNYEYDTKIYELLIHKSGLRDFRFAESAEIMEKLIMDAKVMKYADINYIILFFILEKIGGYTKLLDLHVLQPLSISSETFDFSSREKNIENAIPTEYKKDRGQICGSVHDSKCFAMGGISCHAGIFAKISSFTRIFANLDKLLDTEWYQKFLEKYTIDNRTIGFSVGDERGQSGSFETNCYFHTGFSGTSILLTKDLQQGVVTFTNRIHPTRDNMKIFEFRKLISDEFYKEIKT